MFFDKLNWTKNSLENIDNILITACGTAYHAGLVAKHYIERFAKIPVSVEIASEYRYSRPLTTGRTLCIVISQSGETIDTLAALKEAKRLGAQSIAVTNSIGSSIARETDVAIYTLAGPEIAVASTKSIYYTAGFPFDACSLYGAGKREYFFGTGEEADCRSA